MNTEMIARLQDERNKAVGEARALVDAAEAEKRSLSAEETVQFAKINEAIDATAAQVDELLKAEERAKAADAARGKYEELVRSSETRSDERGEDPVLAVLRGEKREVTLTREERDITAANTAAFVPVNFYDTLVATFEASNNFLNAKPTILRTAGGNDTTVPTVTAYVAAEQVAEANNVSSETDFTDAAVTLKAWKFKGFTQASEELVADAGIEAVQFIAKNLGKQVARAAGKQYIEGDGTTEPQGVFVGFSAAVTAASASLTMDNLIDLQHSVNDEYRQNGVWLMKDSTVAVARKLKDQDDNYLWQPSNIAGQPDLLLGKPVVSDAFAPAVGTGLKSVAFGDFNQGVIVRIVNDIVVARSDEFGFANDLISWKAILRTDSKVVDAAAVKLLVHA